MALVRTRVTTGPSLTARLSFVGLRPLTHDYTISLRLRAAGGQWQLQEDGTPAQGAIPTLKWIRGTVVVDARHLSLPPESVLDGAQLEMLVYDAFTLAMLPPLDERILARGPMVPLRQYGWINGGS
jgi:hypothetical protein